MASLSCNLKLPQESMISFFVSRSKLRDIQESCLYITVFIQYYLMHTVTKC